VAGKTLGEIPEDEKNKMSHRARALRSLITELGL
jgi:inosine/xanthosine triphosphate pyrophosphatase family protein